jgi:hypothetical protein
MDWISNNLKEVTLTFKESETQTTSSDNIYKDDYLFVENNNGTLEIMNYEIFITSKGIPFDVIIPGWRLKTFVKEITHKVNKGQISVGIPTILEWTRDYMGDIHCFLMNEYLTKEEDILVRERILRMV